ncbi:MAG: DUF1385 domain-containing protein [Acidimicrobiia bacterium]
MSRPPGATIGGQAVLEGVMMRAPHGWAVACRTPGGRIEAESHELPRLSSRSRWGRVPFVRGALVLVEALTLGFRALSWSAQKASGEDEEPLSSRQIAVSMTLALVIFAGLFMLLPVAATGWLGLGADTPWFHLVEAGIRIGLFLGYLWAIGRSSEIRRVFAYHGAEHMTIHAYEAGDPLGIADIRGYRPEHPRCGTSFLLIVLLVAIVVFSLFGDFGYLPGPSLLWLVLSRLVLIPVIAGVAYEVLKLAAFKPAGVVSKVLAAPGLWLQRMTTAQPEDPMIEVAVTSLLFALDDTELEGLRSRGPVVPEALAVLEQS